MTSCCPRRRRRWSGATGAIARGKHRATGYARRGRSVHAWRWLCGVKPKPKAVNTPSRHCIVHGLDKPGVFTTVSKDLSFTLNTACNSLAVLIRSSKVLVRGCLLAGRYDDADLISLTRQPVKNP